MIYIEVKEKNKDKDINKDRDKDGVINSFDEIEKMMTDILVKYNMLKVPINIVELANKENIDVYEVSLENESGLIVYNDEKEKYNIVLNCKLESFEKRIVIAYELAYYFLLKSKLDIDGIHCYESGKNKIIEYCAQSLLINKILLKKIFNNIKSIRKLSEIFDVSASYMTKRLDILELL